MEEQEIVKTQNEATTIADTLKAAREKINFQTQNKNAATKETTEQSHDLSVVTIFRDEDKEWVTKHLLPHIPNTVEVVLCKTVNVSDKPRDYIPQYKIVGEADNVKWGIWEYREFSFATARNAAKTFATRNWILSLDCDEYVSPKAWDEIFSFIKAAPEAIGGAWVGVGGWIPNKPRGNEPADVGSRYSTSQVRLFRNEPELIYIGHAHEQIIYNVVKNNYSVSDLRAYIDHDSYDNTEPLTMATKAYRNLKLLARDINENHSDAFLKSHFLQHLLKTARLLESIIEEEGEELYLKLLE